MVHDPSYIKELFSRFMAGQCSREEIDVLITYLETAGDDQMLPSVEEFREGFPELRQMEGAASARILQQLNAALAGNPDSREIPKTDRPARTTPTDERGLPRRRWLQTWPQRAVAAVLVLFAVSAVFYLSYDFSASERYGTGNAQIRSLELEDGTRVSLNANSELRVRLSEEVREVWLEGEAFFSVAHDAAKKFIVHTSDEFSVEVLGTEFNVKDRGAGTRVVLNKGSVKVNLRHGDILAKQLLIEPGEMVKYEPKGDSLLKSRVDTVRYSSWKDNLLIFDEMPLRQVALTIENQFGYTVNFASGDLADLRFTGSNPADKLDMLLETLERSFGLSITKSGSAIHIGSSQ